MPSTHTRVGANGDATHRLRYRLGGHTESLTFTTYATADKVSRLMERAGV